MEPRMDKNMHLQSLDIWAKGLNYTSTFMPQTHVCIQIMLICATKTAVSDPDEDFVTIELATVRGSLDDAPIWRAFIDNEVEAVGGGVHGRRKVRGFGWM